MGVGGGQVIPPLGHRRIQEDSAEKGAGVGGDREVHEVSTGRPRKPDHSIEEEVVQKIL